MNNYRKKHKVLELFLLQAKKYPVDPVNGGIDDLVKQCLTLDSIHSSSRYERELIKTILYTLKTAEQIEIFYEPQIDPHGLENYYLITNEGRKAYQERFYLLKIWYNTQKFWFSIAPIILSIAALIVSIVALVNGTD